MKPSAALRHLDRAQQECVSQYVALLAERLGEELLEVWLFGSAARGDMWSERMPFHSDIDLLVLTRTPVARSDIEELGNQTYPLFLKCGRQIAPQFKTMSGFGAPKDERTREFFDRVRAEGVVLLQRPST